MATNHTTNYQLNLWEPGDSFLREEFNQNSQKIDAALDALTKRTSITAGFYTGTGEDNRQINLGYRPKAVLVLNSSGATCYKDDYTMTYGGLAIDGSDAEAIQITDAGFRVRSTIVGNVISGNSYCLNQFGYKFHYLALK